MPERPQWATSNWRDPVNNPWAQEAIAQRGYDDYTGEARIAVEPEPEDAEHDLPRPRHRTMAAVRAAVADATGVDASELRRLTVDDLTATITHDLDDPAAVLDAIDAALDDPSDEPKAAPGESDGAYRVREGNWRQRHNMPRKRSKVPPSHTREGRRARHIARKAAEWGVSIADAELRIPRRQSPKRKRPRALNDSTA
jgi:hypothetical protein